MHFNPIQVKERREKWRNDPVLFSEELLGTVLWEKEKEILLAVRDNKEVAVRSCHASGKTYTAARIIHWWLLCHDNSIVITTAPTFRQVKEILWREIRGAVAGKNIYPLDSVLDTKISLSDQWFALGISTDRPDQFQGFHSPHLMVVIDEASGISQDIFEAIDSLSAQKILMIGNPLQNTGRFADSFKSPSVKKIHISAFDTPNVSSRETIIPGLLTIEDIERIKGYYGEDSNVYKVRVLGEFPSADANSLIGVDEVEKAIEREVSVLPQWEKKMGVDPARFGDDRTAIVVRQMEKVIRKNVFSSLNTMEIAGLVLNIAKEEHVLAHNIFIDSIGIGAGVVDRLREQGWNVQGINVAEKPNDHEHYLNMRAELYGLKLKEWIKTGSFPKDDDFYELATIRYFFNSKGQLQIESKEDMKKRGLSSPDVSDALMLTFAGIKKIIMPIATPSIQPYYGDADISL